MSPQHVGEAAPFRAAAPSAASLPTVIHPAEVLERLQALQAVTDVALTHLDFDQLLQELLARVRAVLRTDTATFLLTENGSTLRVRASQGFGDEVEQAVEMPLGRGLAGRIAANRVALIVDDVSRVETVDPALRTLASMLVAPMLVEGRVIGVVHAGSFQPRRFADADLHLIQLVADRLALVIDRARLSQELQGELDGRRQSEEAERRSSEHFRLLVESVVDYAIFMLDPHGNVVSWNPGACRIKGYEAAEILGKHFSIFYPPEANERGLPQTELELAAREGRFEDEGWRLRKDGSRFWANVVISAIRSGESELIGFAKVTRDLTERKRAEVEREELLEAEQLARIEAEVANRTKSDFLAVISHELRTPLTAVIGYTEVLEAGVGGSLAPQQLQYLGRVRASAHHLLALIEEILSFARVEAGREELRLRPVDLRNVIQEAISLIHPQAEERLLECRTALPESPVETQ